ncbi:MAG: AGE family epimerase/isomerase, partial [Allorhizobium sp.]
CEGAAAAHFLSQHQESDFHEESYRKIWNYIANNNLDREFGGWHEELTEDGIHVRKPGKFTKMVDQVEHVTFSGKRAREQGQDVLYVTERCVMRLTDSGLVATEIMPGIEPQRDIVAASQGRVKVASDARVISTALLSKDPMGWTP